MYAGCPILSKSQLQTEIAFSTTEADYTGLSYALREFIPLMELLKEMKEKGFDFLDHKVKVHCIVFEDNSGAKEMVVVHKWIPRTKHLSTKLHHFRSYVNSGKINVHKIYTSLQPADVLTKPLNYELLKRHRKTIMGWLAHTYHCTRTIACTIACTIKSSIERECEDTRVLTM